MFRSLFDDDPFFRNPMAEMHRMMGMQMMSPQLPMHPLMGGERRYAEPSLALMAPRHPMQNLFGGMPSLFGNVQNQMQMMSSHHGMPGSSFQSSFTSISYGDGNERPQVYQASSSTKVGPDGVKETQKSERNSVSGLQKMAIGHHIGERAHVLEKSYNSKTGDKEESQEFINLDEDDAETFNQEWKEKTRSHHQHPRHRQIGYRPGDGGRGSPYVRSRPRAIEYQPHAGHRHRQQRKREDHAS